MTQEPIHIYNNTLEGSSVVCRIPENYTLQPNTMCNLEEAWKLDQIYISQLHGKLAFAQRGWGFSGILVFLLIVALWRKR